MDDQKFHNDYKERQPVNAPSKSALSKELAIVAIFLVANIAVWSAYGLMPDVLFRSAVDTCVAVGGVVCAIGLVLSFIVWFESY